MDTTRAESSLLDFVVFLVLLANAIVLWIEFNVSEKDYDFQQKMRYVEVRLPGSSRLLNLGEVYVLGWLPPPPPPMPPGDGWISMLSDYWPGATGWSAHPSLATATCGTLGNYIGPL